VATVIQAYRFALDPTAIQRRALASHCGAARVAYNWVWP
jgi:putative transposase